MGEHTDYNEGFVLPFALPRGVTALASARDDGLLVLRSKQVPDEPVTVSLDSLAPGAVRGTRGTGSGKYFFTKATRIFPNRWNYSARAIAETESSSWA